MEVAPPLLFLLSDPADPPRRQQHRFSEQKQHSARVAYAKRIQHKHARPFSQVRTLPKPQNAQSIGQNDETESLNPLLRSPKSHPDWLPAERQGVNDFLYTTAANLKTHSDGAFFNIVSPCLANHDRGIRDILLAIVDYQSSYSSPTDSTIFATSRKAILRCNTAIHHFRKNVSNLNPEIIKASCILFACIQILHLRLKDAQGYINTALAFSGVLSKDVWSQRSKSARRAYNLTYQSNQSSLLDQAITTTLVKSSVTARVWFPDDKSVLGALTSLDLRSDALCGPLGEFSDVLTAFERILVFCNQLTQNLAYQAYIDSTSSLANHLRVRLDQLQGCLPEVGIDVTRGAVNLTHLNYILSAITLLRITVHCQILGAYQTDYDLYLTEFEISLRAIEKVVKSISPTPRPFVFIPLTFYSIHMLWFIVIYCRDPNLRRRAISLLELPRRNEAGADSWITFNVANTIVKLEEGGRQVLRASDIPETARIIIRGFEADDTGALWMLYAFPLASSSYSHQIWRTPLIFEPDPAGIVPTLDPQPILECLSILHKTSAQRDATEISRGSILPVMYDDQPVTVFWARNA